MTRIGALLSGVALLCVITCAHASWWMDQPYGSSDEFNERVEYTEDHVLECSDDRVSGNNSVFQYWIRPDLTVMYAGMSEFFNTLDGTAGWNVTSDGHMYITIVQEEHFGFYYCIRESANNQVEVVKVGLNYKGAYFGDLWDIYRLNVIIGCSAAGGFLAACVAIYVIHHVFSKDDLEDQVDKQSLQDVAMGDEGGSYGNEKSGVPGNSNGGYVIDAFEDTTKL